MAYFALFALGVIWGSNFIFMKWASDLISPTQTVFLRVLFGFLTLLLLAWRNRALHREQFRHLPHLAVMSVLATTFYYHGFMAGTALLPSSIAGLLSGSIPVFTLVCAWLFLRQDRPGRMTILGIAIGFTGIVLSARPWQGAEGLSVTGVLWMLSGTLSLGLSFVYAQRFLAPLKIAPLALATWQTGLALISLIPLTNHDGIMAITSDTRAFLGVAIGLGILGTGVAFHCYYIVIDRLGSVRASGATHIAPVVAVAIGAAVGESISGIVIVALLMIMGSVYLIQTDKRRESPDGNRTAIDRVSAS